MKNLFIAIFLLSPLFLLAQEQGQTQEAAPANADDALQDTVKLKEVVVKVSRPISKIEGDGFVTQIQGSVLQELGTAKDVLGFIPGIQNNNGNITVLGRGAPTVYINGRMVRTEQDLDQLRADKIKTVKLITNPGARYNGQTNAVIRITTVKNLGEGFALDSRSSFTYDDYFGGKEDVSANYRHNNLDIFGNLEYRGSKSKNSVTTNQNAWIQTHNHSINDDYSHAKRHSISGKIGFNYSVSDKHHFGVYYRTAHGTGRVLSESTSEFYQNDLLIDNSQVSSRSKGTSHQHLLDAYYNGSWGGWEANFTFDALWKNRDGNQSIQEQSASASRDMLLNNKNRGRLLAGELHLTHNLWLGSISFGGQYTNSDRKDTNLSDYEMISSGKSHINEGNLGVYVELSQDFKWVNAQIGLRYEHVYSNYYENAVKMHGQCRKYNELLPSVNLVFPIRESTLQLGYTRKYERPSYSLLSSNIEYVNQYQYESGNPYLKPSFSDVVSLNFRWKWLMLMSAYTHENDLIVTTASAYKDSQTITLISRTNSPYDAHFIAFYASFVPGMIKGFYYPVLTVGGVQPFQNIDFCGRIKKMNRPTPLVSLQNYFQLPDNYSLTANFKWVGKGNTANTTQSSRWQIDFSAQKYFGKHWSVKLSVNDIFNTAHKTWFTSYSSVRSTNISWDNTSRNFDITVGYKFNTTKSRYKGKGAGQSEKDRL